MLGGLWNAAQAFRQRSDHNVGSRPFPGSRPILDVFTSAPGREGGSAESTNTGLHHAREAQALNFDKGNAAPRGPTKRMKELVQVAGEAAEIRE